MKKNIIFLIFILGLSMTLKAQSDSLSGYYYADGLKQYWQTDSTSINIIVRNQQNYDSIALRLERIMNHRGGSVIYDDEDNNIIAESNSSFTPRLVQNLLNSIILLRNDIAFVSYAKTLTEGRIWLTNEVYVKLKDSLNYNSYVVPILSNYSNISSYYEGDNEWRFVCKTEDDVVRLANHLYDTNYVVYSTPDYYDEKLSLCNINDPLYYNQWALNNSNNGVDIKAEKAWIFLDKILGECGSYIKVAVIDDGVEEHEDLYLSGGVSKVLTGYTANGDGTGRPRPNNKHGECCAGIIAASHNNIGVRGIAPNARIVPIRIFKNNNKAFSSAKIAKSIKKAWTDFNCSVFSCSWANGANDKIKDAFNYVCTQGRNGKGCITAAAAGNLVVHLLNGDSIAGYVLFPAKMGNVIAVGAVNENGNRVFCSDYGKGLNIVAPGNGIKTIDREGNYGYSDSNYFNFDNTSAACPHVSGVVALMLSANPELTRQQVVDIIEQTAQKNLGNYFNYPNYNDTVNGTWNEEVGYGLIDAHKAVVKAYMYGCNMVINGASILNECSQYTYAFSMPKSEAFTYNWQVSNNLSIIYENDSIITVVPCGNGNATITANLYSEGRFVHSVSKNIQIDGNNLNSFTSLCQNPLSISNNTVWSNNNLLLGNTVTVIEGGRLTITGTIHCLENASIIVKPGGQLILDGGTLTSACPGEMWQGIQVWGDVTAPQTATNGVYQQGYVELKNGATIENAVCALDLWKPDDYTKTGGIVVATDANFINNAKAIHALCYSYFNNNTYANYNSSITNCNFEINSDYLGTATFYKHIDLASVKNIPISGCSFSVDRTANNISDYCLGIGAYDASFSVSSHCNVPNAIPCPSVSEPSFSGFYKAINVEQSTNTQLPFQVMDCEFNDNTFGIYAQNAGYATILGNNFNVPDGETCSYGAYLKGVSSLYVADNDFVGVGQYNDNNCGVAVKDSPYDNTIMQNNFTNLAYGTESIGKNYNIVSIRPWNIVTLNYSCNNNSGNVHADLYITNDDNNTVNGIYSQGSSSCSAGNTFSSSPIYQICNITAQPFSYYYDTIYSGRKPTSNSTCGVNLYKSNNANDCGLGGGGSSNKSPLVDYDEAVTRCEKIKSALEAETNPEIIEVLEAELAQAESRRLSIIGNAVRGILTDSVSDINETRQWLYRAHTPSADRAICATYLSQGDYETAISKATSMIDKYEMEDDALIEQTEYISILRLQQKVESDGRVMQSLNADELKQVQRLADNGTGVARSIANALLQMNGLAIAECDCANGIAPTRNTETIADGVIESSEADSYLFAISPVPAKDYIIIDYNLPTDHATLTITNNLGVTVKKIAINSKSGKKVLPLPEIKAGVYSCTMSCEGFVETQKIVLTK